MVQAQIRPPRWLAPLGSPILEGGSRHVQCAVCPVRNGAFRQTVDSHEWVHQVPTMAVPVPWLLRDFFMVDFEDLHQTKILFHP